MKLSDRLLRLIERQPGNVIFRREIVGLGSPAQITAALTALIAKGVIVRISIGIYARTRKSSVTGAIVPAGSLETLATEILTKMGVPFTQAEMLLPTTLATRRSCPACLSSIRVSGA
jgi:hypothetical protein